MLTEEQMAEVRAEFNDLISSIDGLCAEEMISYLNEIGFYEAPFSSKYNCAFEGGLLLHSLNVYYALSDLTRIMYKSMFDERSVKILGLLHCITKSDMFEKAIVNKKVYCEDGNKHDALGDFKWVEETCYRAREQSERNALFDKNYATVRTIERFIPLTDEEAGAILNNDCGMDNGFANKNLSTILANNKLAVLLHCAILMTTYIDENSNGKSK